MANSTTSSITVCQPVFVDFVFPLIVPPQVFRVPHAFFFALLYCGHGYMLNEFTI
jgi:hypothetical protein